MNTYLINQKIKTVATLGMKFEERGYTFSLYEPEKGLGSEEWIASKQIQATDYHKASLEFRQGIIPVLDSLSVLTQCSFSVIATSFFTFRENENNDRLFYFYMARDVKAVGMYLWEKDQLEDLKKLLSFENTVALYYFRESNVSSTAKTRLTMLVIAAEAIAGQVTRTRKCAKCGEAQKCSHCGTEQVFSSSDRAKLAEIVGQNMYERLYVKDHGSLRHRLFHGNLIPDQDVIEVVPGVYENMLEYLKKTLGLKTVQKIVNAPRSFTSFEHGGIFLKAKEQASVDLRTLDPHWRDASKFDFADEPKGY